MIIPDKNVVPFVKQLIDQCLVSRVDRISRGTVYRNLFLTGDENSDTAIYNKIYEFIDTLSSELYSPSELRFGVEFYGSPTVVDRSMGYSASSELNRQIRQGSVDTMIEQAVTWGLVKGKCFIKLLWTEDGFEPYLIQPEYMGVLREDIDSLDRQEAFVQSTYYTPDKFAELIKDFPDRDKIMNKVKRYMEPDKAGDMPERAAKMKQVILGGLYPYTGSGVHTQNNQATSKGVVDWLGSPAPTLSPEVMQTLICMDELWVWDDGRNDYTVFQMVGDDILLTGLTTHRNIFADMWDVDNKKKSIKTDNDNPLSGMNPFIEICPNPIDGYFWGRSEISNVALLQKCINTRINGINALLRLQEDPPRYYRTGLSMKQQQESKLRKPGGYLVDSNNQAQPPTSLAPELPGDLWASLHEYIKMFDNIGGFPPVMQGRGESGVRAQGHAETLARMASPRFKDRALLLERQISEIGGLAFSILKAKHAEQMVAWIMPKDQTFIEYVLTRLGVNPKGIDTKLSPDADLLLPPVSGMKPVPFLLSQISHKAKVVVDSHSSSPAFSHDTRALLFDLFKVGVVTKEQLAIHTNPPGLESILEDIKKAEIAQQEFAEKNPDVVAEQAKKKKH